MSSENILHSWDVLSLGLKAGTIPGHLNQATVSSNHPGLFYGQCLEICESNNSCMPIILEIVHLKCFESWSVSITEDHCEA